MNLILEKYYFLCQENLPERSTRWRQVERSKATDALCHWSFPNLQYVLLIPQTRYQPRYVQNATKGSSSLKHKCSQTSTSSGERSKTLPPMVNETVGILESCEQSTADSPLGLGMRSHIWECFGNFRTRIQKNLIAIFQEQIVIDICSSYVINVVHYTLLSHVLH